MRAIQIYLDDSNRAPFGMVQTNTVEDTIVLLSKCTVSVLSLDHDLGYEKTGYDVLLWIEEQVVKSDYRPPPLMAVHSWNAGARSKMLAAIEKIKSLVEAKG